MGGALIFFLNAKTRYRCGLTLLKMLNQGTAKVRLGYDIVQKAKIRYG